jgi:hypothetical protein
VPTPCSRPFCRHGFRTAFPGESAPRIPSSCSPDVAFALNLHSVRDIPAQPSIQSCKAPPLRSLVNTGPDELIPMLELLPPDLPMRNRPAKPVLSGASLGLWKDALRNAPPGPRRNVAREPMASFGVLRPIWSPERLRPLAQMGLLPRAAGRGRGVFTPRAPTSVSGRTDLAERMTRPLCRGEVVRPPAPYSHLTRRSNPPLQNSIAEPPVASATVDRFSD